MLAILVNNVIQAYIGFNRYYRVNEQKVTFSENSAGNSSY